MAPALAWAASTADSVVGMTVIRATGPSLYLACTAGSFMSFMSPQ